MDNINSAPLNHLSNKIVAIRQHLSEKRYELKVLQQIQMSWAERWSRGGKFQDSIAMALWCTKLPAHIASQQLAVQMAAMHLTTLEEQRRDMLREHRTAAALAELEWLRRHREHNAADEVYALALDMEIYQQEQVVNGLMAQPINAIDAAWLSKDDPISGGNAEQLLDATAELEAAIENYAAKQYADKNNQNCTYGNNSSYNYAGNTINNASNEPDADQWIRELIGGEAAQPQLDGAAAAHGNQPAAATTADDSRELSAIVDELIECLDMMMEH